MTETITVARWTRASLTAAAGGAALLVVLAFLPFAAGPAALDKLKIGRAAWRERG